MFVDKVWTYICHLLFPSRRVERVAEKPVDELSKLLKQATKQDWDPLSFEAYMHARQYDLMDTLKRDQSRSIERMFMFAIVPEYDTLLARYDECIKSKDIEQIDELITDLEQYFESDSIESIMDAATKTVKSYVETVYGEHIKASRQLLDACDGSRANDILRDLHAISVEYYAVLEYTVVDTEQSLRDDLKSRYMVREQFDPHTVYPDGIVLLQWKDVIDNTYRVGDGISRYAVLPVHKLPLDFKLDVDPHKLPQYELFRGCIARLNDVKRNILTQESKHKMKRGRLNGSHARSIRRHLKVV